MHTLALSLFTLSVALVLCAQMICSTWRDTTQDRIEAEEHQTRPTPFDQGRRP